MLDRGQALHRRLHQLLQVPDRETRADAADRLTDRPGRQPEELRRLRRRVPQFQLAVQQHHRQRDALDQVAQIVVDQIQLIVARLELLVQRDQLLVGRLELLLGALQFLVGALQLLVGAEHLLIGGAQLLVGRFELDHQGAQLRLRALELVGQRGHRALELVHPRARRTGRRAGRLGGVLHLRRQRHEEVLERLAGLQREHLQRIAAIVEGHALAPHRLGGALGLDQRGAHRDVELRMQQPRQGERRLAAGRRDEGRDLAAELDHVARLVHHEARRHVARQRHAVGGLADQVGRRRLRDARGRALARPGAQRVDGEQRPLPARVGQLAVQMRRAGMLEAVGRRGRLRAAQQHETVGARRVVEHLEDVLLRFLAQVDQHVAAADQAHPGEGGVRQQVVTREHAHLAQVLGHQVAAGAGHEGRVAEGLRHVLQRRRAVAAGAGGLDRGLVDVGAEDLHPAHDALGDHRLLEQHGDGVDLLAGGAGRHPDADRVMAQLQQLGQHHLPQHVDELRVAEEGRHADQHVVAQRGGLVRVGAQELQVGADVAVLLQQHAPQEAAAQVDVLDVAQVHPGLLLDDGQRGLQRVGAVGRAQRRVRQRVRRVAEAPHQRGRDVGRGQDLVDQAGVDGRGGHAVMGGGLRRLRQRQAARGLQVDDAGRAVLAGARQDDHGRVHVRILGHRGQAGVDRQVQPGLAAHQPEMTVQRDHAGVLRHHVDAVVLDAAQVLQALDRQRGAGLEHFRKLGLLVRIQVRDDQDRETGVLGEGAQHRAQRVDAAGGSAQHDDAQGLSLFCLHPVSCSAANVRPSLTVRVRDGR